jgi:pyrimidine oxygenase
MKDLWIKGRSDFKGKNFIMNDCKLSPKPSYPIKIVAAGQSPRGTQFAAEYADYNFMGALGYNQPRTFENGSLASKEAADKTGRDVGAMVLFMIMIIDYDSDEEAQAKWDFYAEGVDLEATNWVAGQATKDTKADSTATASRISKPDNPVNCKEDVSGPGFTRQFSPSLFLPTRQTIHWSASLSSPSKRRCLDWFLRDSGQIA